MNVGRRNHTLLEGDSLFFMKSTPVDLLMRPPSSAVGLKTSDEGYSYSTKKVLYWDSFLGFAPHPLGTSVEFGGSLVLSDREGTDGLENPAFTFAICDPHLLHRAEAAEHKHTVADGPIRRPYAFLAD